MFRFAGSARVGQRFAVTIRVPSLFLASSPSQLHQTSSRKLAQAYCGGSSRSFSSDSTSTWNWNNFAATDKTENSEGGSNDSQESQVLKKTGQLYMSLMPLNEKVLLFFLMTAKEWISYFTKTFS